ncbi:MAG TPA: NUDIX domain-containing protein [Acidothermaceae bacterium]|nr:NUDIX domain-containing protein [Acidothermaceae bacterium]
MPEIAAVGAIAVRDGALLLIRRGHAPSRGRWSLPGGRVEPGETAREALVREMAEETGLTVEVGELVGEVVRPGPNEVTYRIQDFRVTPVGDDAVAGDDALDVEWVPLADVAKRQLSAGLLGTLRQWAVI